VTITDVKCAPAKRGIHIGYCRRWSSRLWLLCMMCICLLLLQLLLLLLLVLVLVLVRIP
jgi:hypothetical protein